VQLTFNLQNLLTCASNANGILRQVTYDLYDRPATVTDANGVTVSYTYDKLGRPVARTWPDSHGETYGWSTNGLAAFTNRDGKVTRYVHEAAGRTIAETNANLEVTGIGYDPAGHTISLINGLGKTNGWAYDVYGRCLAKRDANGNLVFTNAYNANGWVMTNWTPAGGFTSYKRDAVGNVTNIDYTNASIATPTVSMAYDALNQLTNLIDGIGTTRYTYTAIGQLASEVGPWPTNGINYTYNQGHRTSMSITSVVSTLDFTYGYDLGWRMESVTSPAGAIGYIYPNSASALVAGIALPNGASIANNYDSLGRLTGTALLNHWGHVLDGYTYTPDLLGLRTNILRNLGLTTNSVAVGYDNIGQMTVWNAVEGTAGTSRMNEQNWFGYDAGDNLTGRTEGGLGLEQTFTVDALNQLTNVAHIGGKLTVTGSIPAPAASVTVDGVAAQLYGDLTFAGTNNSYTLTNGWNTFTNIAQNAYGLKVTNLLTVNLPLNTPIHYDANGNLATDGLRAFTFDAADRMTNVYVTNQWKEEFAYDGLSRRRILKQYTWSSGTWLPTNEVHFLFDGLQIVQERDSSNIPQVTYTHGLDLSGTLSGAGGIGGLLARTDTTNGSTFYHSDGAGNVTALMDMYENIVARYLYGPFGKLLGQWGKLASANTMRFSSMPGDSIAGIVGFSYRFYDPNLQRWLNQDPIGEAGGINLYGFVGNSPLNAGDPYGLSWYNPFSWSAPSPNYMSPNGTLSYVPPAPAVLPAPPPQDDSPFADINVDAGKWAAEINPDDSQWASQTIRQVGESVADGLFQVVMMDLGPGEVEEVYVAVEETLQGAEDAGMEVNMVSKCDKAAERTPLENRIARNKFKNNKDAAKEAWEKRTGKEWPETDGKDWPAHHEPSLKSGGDPMNVEPQSPSSPDPHNIVGPDGKTDYQRWGALGPPARQGNR